MLRRDCVSSFRNSDETSPCSTKSIFPFEEPNEDLGWIPLAARRALDHAGLKLSLAAWRGLGMSQRRALISAGTAPAVAIEAVERLVAAAAPPANRTTPRPDPDAGSVPQALMAALGERASELSSRWQTLEPLERYVLDKLVPRGEGGRPGRLYAAHDYFLRAKPAAPHAEGKATQPSHLDERGEARMVDVSAKPATKRVAVAGARLSLAPATLEALAEGRIEKGDALATARIAGIQAAKRTPELIPLCHGVALTSVEVALELVREPPSVVVTATARAFDRTGVEMEALVAASVASLTLYDMLKSIDREMTVGEVALLEKSGGRSGHYRRNGA